MTLIVPHALQEPLAQAVSTHSLFGPTKRALVTLTQLTTKVLIIHACISMTHQMAITITDSTL